MKRTSFSVELNFCEEICSFFSDELMSFEDIGEVVFVHSLCVPLESESTTNERLISIKSNKSLIVSDIEWLREEVHLAVHGNMVACTVVGERVTTVWTTESTLSLEIAIDCT